MSNRGQRGGRGGGGGGGGRGRGQGYGGGGGDGGGRGRGGPPDRGRGGGFNFRGGAPSIFKEGTPAQIPDRLSTANLSTLINGFKKLQVGPERPIRPGYGTLGTPITLRSNFFAIKLPKGPVYDYVVEIEPSPPPKKQGGDVIKRLLFEALEREADFKPHLSYIAHDKSQRIISARRLPQPLDFTLSPDRNQRQPPSTAPSEKKVAPSVYTLNIRFQQTVEMNDITQYLSGSPNSVDFDFQPFVTAMNLVVQQHAARTGTRVGKNRYFFPSSAMKVSLEPGVEAIQGFYASVRPTYKELMVNVNVCMSAFFQPGNIADILFAFNRRSSGAMPTLPPGMVGKVKVRVKYLGRKKTIKGVGTRSARATTFEYEGAMISVEAYFKTKYGITLKHAADLPLIDVSSRGKSEPTWIPAEQCDIEPGEPYGKLNDKQTAAMIRYACNPPKVNAEAIVGPGFQSLGFNPSSNPMNGFGMAVSTDMAVIPGRLLPPPQLMYKSGKPNVKSGGWNIVDVQFHRGATVLSWWVMVIRDGRNTVTGPQDERLIGLVNGFKAKCQRSGMAMPKDMPALIPVSLPSPNKDPGRLGAIGLIKNTFNENLKKLKKPNFVLVLLENRDNYIYPAIKRIGDTLLGIHTVHMQLDKALIGGQKQDQYFSNVALKVNIKLGGINHLLSPQAMDWLTKEKTMLVGIDVTHPGIGSKRGTPSIAAVVASVDDSFVQFPASLRIQESKKEMLDELSQMLIERLKVYEKKNKVLPKRIFVFRDGVSEGQYATVLKEELPQIIEAFKRVSASVKYAPRLSIIICGKRHHARFFPEKSEHADKNGNTLPGTVVDKGVTEISGFDFYLQAHAGLQGTVKATHYVVVYDENKLQADEIQQGTHTVSYLYARATKAVSLVPPAYYADLACERGRCYINNFLVNSDAQTTASGASKSSAEEEKQVFEAAKKAWGEGLHSDMKESMFYI